MATELPICQAYWIQISGGTLLSAVDVANASYGNAPDTIYNDYKNVQKVKDLIRRFSAKRPVDNFVLDWTAAQPLHKTALIFPPIIYGSGRGPVKSRSVQIPEISRITLQNKTGIQVGEGKATWSNIHITDLSQIFLALVEKAANGDNGGFWDENGLYFPENGSLVSFGAFCILEIPCELTLVVIRGYCQTSHA